MEKHLIDICDIDRKIKLCLLGNEINSQEIAELVDRSDQILQVLLNYASKNEQFAKSQQWQDAVNSTKQLVRLMESETSKLGDELRKFRLGQRSVQQYKKFI